MASFKPTLTEYLRDRLIGRVDRLARLIKLNAPATVLANEIGLINDVADAAWGAGFVASVGSNFRLARAKAGLCFECDHPVANDDSFWPRCAGHLAAHDQEIAAYREGDQNDDISPEGDRS